MFAVRNGRLSFVQVVCASAVGGCHGAGGSALTAAILELESRALRIGDVRVLDFYPRREDVISTLGEAHNVNNTYVSDLEGV